MIHLRVLEILTLLLAFLGFGCESSALGPKEKGPIEAPPGISSDTAPVIGTYLLTVSPGTNLGGGTWEIPINTNFFLVAHVAFPGGGSVTKGSAVFQSFFSDRWHRVGSVPVDQDGEARWGFTGVGFCGGTPLPLARFKYIGQGSGVKNDVSNTVTVQTESCGP